MPTPENMRFPFLSITLSRRGVFQEEQKRGICPGGREKILQGRNDFLKINPRLCRALHPPFPSGGKVREGVMAGCPAGWPGFFPPTCYPSSKKLIIYEKGILGSGKNGPEVGLFGSKLSLDATGFLGYSQNILKKRGIALGNERNPGFQGYSSRRS
jgi:hypothetical protein